MLRTYLSQFLLLFTLLLTNSATWAETSFSQVYIFGDSLSDTGNLAAFLGQPLPPPYVNSRVSNGPVAVETLASKLGHTAEASQYTIFVPEAGSNYAVASAKASGARLQDLSSQVLGFTFNHGYIAPSDALYVIFIGGNDIRATRRLTDINEAKMVVHEAATSVFSAIQNLTQMGARSFLLINAPNVGLIPETLIAAELNNDPGIIKRARKMSNLYRKTLHEMAESFEESNDIQISEFDLFKFFNKLVKKSEKYGFINSSDACFSTVTLSFHPDCYLGLNADQFVFFDEIHPTTKAHTLIGEALYKSLLKQTK